MGFAEGKFMKHLLFFLILAISSVSNAISTGSILDHVTGGGFVKDVDGKTFLLVEERVFDISELRRSGLNQDERYTHSFRRVDILSEQRQIHLEKADRRVKFR